MQIKVAIGVCARDCEDSVKEIVARISNQDFPHKEMEVFFVEEDSKDNTFFSILRHAPEIKMRYQIYRVKGKGLGFSRNIVLKNTQSKYIVWIDDGTIIGRDYISKLVEMMEEHESVGIATGIINKYSGPNLVCSLENMCVLAFSHRYAGNFTKKLPGAGGAIFRVKAMLQVGGFDEGIIGASEDTDIAYRLLMSGWKIFVTETSYSRDYSSNMRKVWLKGLWYGAGLHFMIHKHRELNMWLCRGTPIGGFVEGILNSFNAYKLTRKKIAFLLPIFISIQRTAQCWGFAKAHTISYGHS